MTALVEVPTDAIFPGENVRVKATDDGDDADLVRSVRATGILQPLVVRRIAEGKYRLVVGHRRYEAAVEAGLPTVPALVDPAADDPDAVLQLVENTQRAQMDPLDVSRAIVAILGAEPTLTQETLARRLGRSPSYVSDALKKARRDPRIQRDIARGRIKGRAASLMLNRSPSERKQLLAIADDPAPQPQPLRRLVTRPSVRTMKVDAQDGWGVDLSWDGSDLARLDVRNGSEYEAGVRFDVAQARRLSRAFRLLADAMDAVTVRTA